MPDARSHLTLGRLSKRSQVSQNRAALHRSSHQAATDKTSTRQVEGGV